MEVTAKGMDRRGKEIRIRASYLMAEASKHEIDHLSGVLYIDHVESPKKLQKVQPEAVKSEAQG